jgi:preprotein translocase subunit SecB
MNVIQPDPNAAVISIGAQYVKDLSFENRMNPHFARRVNTGIDLSLAVLVTVESYGQDVYESELRLSTTGKIAGETSFIAELTYAIAYTIRNMDEAMAQTFLNVEAPRHAFPYAAAILTQAITAAGMPPVWFDPVDFAALYNARLADQAQARD